MFIASTTLVSVIRAALKFAGDPGRRCGHRRDISEFACGIRSPSYGREQNVEPLSCRTLTGRNAFSSCFQAVNCQDFGELSRVATFIESLRDKALRVLCGLLCGR